MKQFIQGEEEAQVCDITLLTSSIMMRRSVSWINNNRKKKLVFIIGIYFIDYFMTVPSQLIYIYIYINDKRSIVWFSLYNLLILLIILKKHFGDEYFLPLIFFFGRSHMSLIIVRKTTTGSDEDDKCIECWWTIASTGKKRTIIMSIYFSFLFKVFICPLECTSDWMIENERRRHLKN